MIPCPIYQRLALAILLFLIAAAALAADRSERDDNEAPDYAEEQIA